jgi:hypothetical protein
MATVSLKERMKQLQALKSSVQVRSQRALAAPSASTSTIKTVEGDTTQATTREEDSSPPVPTELPIPEQEQVTLDSEVKEEYDSEVKEQLDSEVKEEYEGKNDLLKGLRYARYPLS